MALLIQNIGEFFTGELAQPTARVNSIRVENGRITALDPEGDRASADTVLDAAGGAVMPGLVDGHVHPVLGEWTPAQDAIGWIGNYLHGGTTTMISAGELHIPGIDYENLSAELVTSLAVVTAATTGRVRWSGVKVYAGTALLVPKMTELHFDRLAAAGVKWVKFLFYPFSANTEEARNYVAWSLCSWNACESSHRWSIALRIKCRLRLSSTVMVAARYCSARQWGANPHE